jgi:phage repressor protein C with HTH and peptisase S24 domain
MAPGEESQVYRDLMRLKPDGLSSNAWAVKAGVNRTVWADMRRHGNPSRRTLEKLLVAAGSSLAEFEALRVGEPLRSSAVRNSGVGEAQRRGWAPQSLPPLPLRESALAGEWGEEGSGIETMEVRFATELDRLPRPASLAGDRDAYAVTVVGDSMWPRFRPGRRVAVSPRSPVAIGDDVLVKLRAKTRGPGEPALLKELVRQTARFVELRQFNPAASFRVDAAEVEAMHKVAGEII